MKAPKIPDAFVSPTIVGDFEGGSEALIYCSSETLAHVYGKDDKEALMRAKFYNSAKKMAEALNALLSMHQESFFICGVDDQQSVDVAVEEAANALREAGYTD